jgi:4-amino-4-deoxy-L-arabinose transferase-like glycosyltransferase
VTRSGDLLLGFVVVAFVLVSRTGWRRRVAQALIAAVAFAAPVVAYATWMDNTRGSFGLTYGYSGHFLYGRVMAFASTTGLDLPVAERSLGPLLEPSRRNLSQLMWNPTSPSWTITPADGKTVDQLDGDFARHVITQQPLDYLRTVAGDFVYNFAPTRGIGPERFPNWYFNFRPGYPAGVAGTQKIVDKYGGTDVGANTFLTHSLYSYGTWWTPGTLLGVLLLAGLAAVAGVGRARGSGMRLACLVICAGLIGALVAPALLVGFSVRYLLPALALAPLVGVLGFTAITGKGRR